ncbi:NUDIX domain-containing protein [Kitasatospora sp. NBC_01250]|uniref:NUDIX domain-containing protein n=1 Tax=unclassified Kitasatospora TaxID=2633591 RepID=UPI002E0F6F78|nr:MULTISPECIES: NUDIX domain-containing protein [unclassified Kitasatospora]WSJ71151.1 NUDIX domain-containing protein [Kitasatospora sp. NBC_01302]
MISPFADPAFTPGLLFDAQETGITRFVVATVITEGDRVLLLRRPADDFMPGLWELPSGKVEPGEDFEKALRRETREETGLTIDQVTAYLGRFDYASKSGALTRQLTFEATVENAAPITLTEHDDHTWADRGELPGVSEAVRKLITR